MAQNIYDDEAFFAGYSTLPRSVHGLAGAPEWHALQTLLPPIQGLRVLDLGCGFGWFCRWAATEGAANVEGVDISSKMLERARSMGVPSNVTYSEADLDSVELEPNSFDLVFSSLTFHYITDLRRLWSEVANALVAGGRFVFSVEHPLFTAPLQDGWLETAAGRRVWPIESYLVEAPRKRDWLAPGVIKQHRTFATYLNLLAELGLTVSRVIEWGPTDEQIEANPAFAEERDRPTFLLVSARRSSFDPAAGSDSSG